MVWAIALIAAAICTSHPAAASVAQHRAAGEGNWITISGYRSAQFGMNDTNVRAAILQDFGPTAATTLTRAGAASGPHSLQLPAVVDSRLGSVAIGYSFDIMGRLMAVSISKAVPSSKAPAERDALITLGQTFTDQQRLLWFRQVRLQRTGADDRPFLFKAHDKRGNSLEVRLSTYNIGSNDTAAPQPGLISGIPVTMMCIIYSRNMAGTKNRGRQSQP